jgi:hypothetical protein
MLLVDSLSMTEEHHISSDDGLSFFVTTGTAAIPYMTLNATDNLHVHIEDNLTGLVTFTVRLVGYRHYP